MSHERNADSDLQTLAAYAAEGDGLLTDDMARYWLDRCLRAEANLHETRGACHEFALKWAVSKARCSDLAKVLRRALEINASQLDTFRDEARSVLAACAFDREHEL